ncbi:hypothetical protein PR001_g20948 [Phytophthora rubi]|uniref:DDE-1 domain-containing protein n=2 Tax=Phytophthora TaxID=4783 RepID=A0A6A3JIX9_9STRA|nr:hypothetical protein PR001_g20948 [Phytophthora rubi]
MALVRSKRARGVKKKNTHITLAFTANADDTDTLPLLFLGRAKQPHCFEKRSVESIGFSFRANAKAWMTGSIFREWLHNLDREMRLVGHHILLLDNASSHKTGDLVCTNIRVEFLPPNITTYLQPMDAGIIALFKRAYERRQLLWVYENIKDVKKLKKEPYAVDQLQAMRWSKEIWQELQGKWAIENCFRHTGIAFNSVDERCGDSNDTTYDEDVNVEDIIMRASQLSL